MGPYHWGQLAFALVVLVVAASAVRRVAFFAAAVDGEPYLRAIQAALRQGEGKRASSLVLAGLPTWLARVAKSAFDALETGDDVGGALDEAWLDVRFEAHSGLRVLRILGTLGSAIGLMGACGYVAWLARGEFGLEGLMPGRAERIAFEGAALAGAIGIGTAMVAFSVLASLRQLVEAEMALCRRAVQSLDRLLGGSLEPSSPQEAGTRVRDGGRVTSARNLFGMPESDPRDDELIDP